MPPLDGDSGPFPEKIKDAHTDMDLNEFSEGLLRNVGQYLEKRNIHLVGSKNSWNLKDTDIYFAVYSLPNILYHMIFRNMTCDFLGFVRVVPLTSSPIPSKSSTTNLIKIDNMVLIFLSLAGALCAAIVALTINSKSKVKTTFGAWLENSWINFSLLFFESNARLPSSWRARMVLATWLLTALLISVEVGSYLKSRFTVTTYDLIDRYQDALPYDNVIFGAISHSPSESLRCFGEEWKKYSGSCKNLFQSGSVANVLDIPENTNHHRGKKTVFMVTFTDLTRLIRNGYEEIRQSGRHFYVGQSPVDVYLFFMLNNGTRANPILRKHLMESALILTENNPWTYEDFEGDYMLESVKWKKPSEDETELFLDDCLVVFNLFFIGIAISCALFLFEVCFYFVLMMANFKYPSSRYSNQIQFPY